MPQKSAAIHEITGQWEELVSRPEFRGHRVKITIMDRPQINQDADGWLESLHKMADHGVKIIRPADDSRQSIYEDT